MIRRLCLLLCLNMCIFTIVPTFADDDMTLEDDAFEMDSFDHQFDDDHISEEELNIYNAGEFDEGGEHREQAGVWGQLRNNATFKLEGLGLNTIDLGGLYFTKLSTKSSVELSDQFTFNVSGYGVLGDYSNDFLKNSIQIEGYFSAPNNQSVLPKIIDFTRFNMVYSRDSYDITVGKASVPSGLGEIHSAANRYSSQYNPLDSGIWQIKFSYYTEDDNQFSFAVYPFESPLPDLEVRDGKIHFAFDFLDLGVISISAKGDASLKPVYFKNRLENWGYHVRYDGSLPGMDYYLSAYHGPSPATIRIQLADSTVLFKRIKSFNTAAGLSLVKGAWKAYGEMAFQFGSGQSDFAKTLFGIHYKSTKFPRKFGLNSMTSTIEVSMKNYFNEIANPVINFNIDQFFNNDIALRFDIAHTDKLHYRFITGANYQNNSTLYQIGVMYQLNDDLFIFANYTASTLKTTQFQTTFTEKRQLVAAGFKYLF